MVVLIGIGFLAGVITAVSPCVLPVLPIILAGSASGGPRRPYAIIAGLVASFTLFTLVAAWLLDQLGLPQDFLRNLAIALLFVVAATLLVPRVGELLERPFLRLARRPAGDLGGGLVLGTSLGLVFVPCAGPVLTAITVISASRQVDAEAVFLTLAYAAGAGLVMLLIAVGGQRAADRTKAVRRHAPALRAALGAVIAGTALLIVFNVDRRFQTAIPGYTKALQRHIEENAYAKRRLNRLTGAGSGVAAAAEARPQRAALPDFGPAPDFQGISLWLNTPGGRPLSLAGLRGKVVLVDFWTYSCINCLRALPHLEAWDRTYRRAGLAVVGVHTPEFAFEHVPSNVRHAVASLGVRYPVALDNGYGTWGAYGNRYWPASYLIDRRGHVRYAHFGEGEYDHTERLIRLLLAERAFTLPPTSRVVDATPRELVTPESYLGYARLDRFAGAGVVRNRESSYRLPPALPQNELAYGGRWRVEAERIVAGRGARLQLHFRARNVFLVLGGRGKVDVLIDGVRRRPVHVAGGRLYTVARFPAVKDARLELRFAPRIRAYAFTFG